METLQKEIKDTTHNVSCKRHEDTKAILQQILPAKNLGLLRNRAAWITKGPGRMQKRFCKMYTSKLGGQCHPNRRHIICKRKAVLREQLKYCIQPKFIISQNFFTKIPLPKAKINGCCLMLDATYAFVGRQDCGGGDRVKEGLGYNSKEKKKKTPARCQKTGTGEREQQHEAGKCTD